MLWSFSFPFISKRIGSWLRSKTGRYFKNQLCFSSLDLSAARISSLKHFSDTDNWQKNWEGEGGNNNNMKRRYFLQSCPGRGAHQHHVRFAQEHMGKVCTKARPCVPIPQWPRCQPGSQTLRSSFRATPGRLFCCRQPSSRPKRPAGPPKNSHTLPCCPGQPVYKTHYFSPKLYVYCQFVNKQPLCRPPAKTRTEAKKCEPKWVTGEGGVRRGKGPGCVWGVFSAGKEVQGRQGGDPCGHQNTLGNLNEAASKTVLHAAGKRAKEPPALGTEEGSRVGGTARAGVPLPTSPCRPPQHRVAAFFAF